MNTLLKAKPLILSLLVILSVGLTTSVHAQIAATDATICAGETATLSAASPSGSVQWYNEAASPGSVPNPTAQVGSGTSYTTPALAQSTTYYAYEVFGGLVVSVDDAIATVNPNPEPINMPANLQYCEGTNFDYTIFVGDDQDGLLITHYFYDESLADTVLTVGPLPIDADFPYVFDLTGIFTPGFFVHQILSTITDPVTGCVSETEVTLVEVVPTPAAPVVSGNTSVCSGGSTTITAVPTGSPLYTSTFQWMDIPSPGGIVLNQGTTWTPENITSDITVYLYEIYQLDDGECWSDPTTVTITALPAPSDPVVVGDEICAGETAFLEANTTSGTGGTINFYADASGTELVASSMAGTFGYTTPPLFQTTSYWVEFVETSVNGCASNLVEVVATVNPGLEAPSVPATATACAIDSNVTITATVLTNEAGADINVLVIEVASGDTVLNAPGAATAVAGVNTISVSGDLNAFPLGDHVAYFTVSDPVTGCESDAAITLLTIGQEPVAPLVLDTVEICFGETATLFAFGDFDSTSYVTWYDVPQFDPIAFGWQYETQPITVDQTYYASVTNEAGCEGPLAAVTVVVNPLPADPVPVDGSACAGESATLGVTGSGGSFTWFSDGAGNNVVATGDSYITPPLSQNTTFYVQETDGNGCQSAIIGVEASVIAAPEAPVALGITLCVDEAGELSASVGSATGDIVWYNNAQIELERDVVPPTEATFAVGPFGTAGTYIYYVSFDDGTCESELVQVEVTVGEAPEAPSAEDVEICAGQTATLTASGSGGDLNWYSDFALTDLVGVGPSYTTEALFADALFYVTESFGSCEGLATEVEVEVNDLPATPTVSSNAPICEGESLELTTDPVFGATYSWTGPNGFTSAMQNPVIDDATEANNQGVYTLTITNSTTGCESEAASIVVEITPTPEAPSLTSNSPVCFGEDVVLTAGAVDGATYTWYDNGGAVIDITSENTLTVGSGTAVVGSGTYGVSISVNGCESATTLTTVAVLPLPDAVDVSSNSPVCEGDAIVLSATVITGATYVWSGPDGQLTESGPVVTVEEPGYVGSGTFSVYVLVDGCPSEETEVDVIVLPAPVLPQDPTYVGSSGTGQLCEYDTLYLQAPDYVGSGTYSWSGPNGYTSDEQNPVIPNITEVNDQGFYTLVVTDDETGCKSQTYELLILIDRFPDNVSADNDGPVCQDEDLTLSATSIFNAEYTWTGPANFQVTTTDPTVTIEGIQPFQAGTYTVTIQLGSCASMQISTEVIVHENPIADAGEDLTIEEGTVFQLDGTGSVGAVDYFWEGEDPEYFDDPTRPNPIIGLNGPLEARDDPYVFILTVWNEFGCTDTDTMLVFVYETLDLIIPNVITPNGDGVNDTWVITFLDNLDNYTLTIFARGGSILAQYDGNYDDSWDGTYEGDDLPEGTYWYTIRYDGDETYEGYIEILR